LQVEEELVYMIKLVLQEDLAEVVKLQVDQEQQTKDILAEQAGVAAAALVQQEQAAALEEQALHQRLMQYLQPELAAEDHQDHQEDLVAEDLAEALIQQEHLGQLTLEAVEAVVALTLQDRTL
jgi:hypothetical protein